jgi:ketosteroid isomerase-like protein
MTPLPTADAATRAEFLRWLEIFSGYVRDVDFASAAPLWHPDVITFGTHRDLVRGFATTLATQWNNVWPKTADFAFVPDQTEVLASADETIAVVIAPWTSTGFSETGERFDRPGRATIVFHRTDSGWRVVHSHMSLHRGVPQTSHADRPVKAWPTGIGAEEEK